MSHMVRGTRILRRFPLPAEQAHLEPLRLAHCDLNDALVTFARSLPLPAGDEAPGLAAHALRRAVHAHRALLTDCVVGEAFEGQKHLRLLAEWAMVLAWMNLDPENRAPAVVAAGQWRSSDTTKQVVEGLRKARTPLTKEERKGTNAILRAASALADAGKEATEEDLWSAARALPNREMAREGGVEALWEVCWGPLHRSAHWWGYDGPGGADEDDLAPAWRLVGSTLGLAQAALAMILKHAAVAAGVEVPPPLHAVFDRLVELDSSRPRAAWRKDEWFQNLLEDYLSRNDPVRQRRSEKLASR